VGRKGDGFKNCYYRRQELDREEKKSAGGKGLRGNRLSVHEKWRNGRRGRTVRWILKNSGRNSGQAEEKG